MAKLSSDQAWKLVEKWRALSEAERERHLAAAREAEKLPADEREVVWRGLRRSLREGGAS